MSALAEMAARFQQAFRADRKAAAFGAGVVALDLSPRRAALTLALLLGAVTLPAAPAAAFTLPFLGAATEAPPPGPPRPVVTEIVTDTLAPERSITGVIAAATEVQMAFQTLGRLIARPVDVGDRVQKGEVLARLDPDDLEGTVRAAEASLSAAQVNLRTATATAERTRALAARNVASRAQLEQAERGLATAQSSADQAQAGLERARNAESYAVMTAPISGVVSAVRATPGAVVAAGDPILTLASETGLEATIDLTETQLAGIRPGTGFLVSHDYGNATPTRGTVDRIAPVADAQTRTRRVHIRLDDAAGFRLGSLIRARLDNSDGAMLTVPLAALLTERAGEVAVSDAAAAPADQGEAAPDGADPESADLDPLDADRPDQAAAPPAPAQGFVWVATRDGDRATVDLRPVTTGAVTGNRVVITSGLTAGEEVVIRGVHSLTEGQAVGRRMDP